MMLEDLLIRVRAETAEATAGLSKLTAGVGMLGIAAGVIAAGAFVKMGIDAQTELSRVQGLAGVTASEMQGYSSALEGMGTRIGSTMAESAKGLYYVVSAGFKGADALNVLNYAEMAAHASGADLADVSHGVAGALNAYGAKASEAGRYTDIMTGAVVHGMQTYQQFAQEMGTATAVASAHKVPLIELAAAEASLTQKGMSAQMAFTGLTFAMAKVMVPADEMSKKVRAAGGHFDAAAWSAMSFVDRLNYLHGATGISETDFTKLIGGTRSSKAALDLVNDSGKLYHTTLGQLANSAGLTASAFAVHDATIEGGMHRVQAAISNAAYEFVKFITPTVVSFLEKLGSALVEVSTHVQQYAPLIGGIAVAATILLAAAVWNLAAAVIGATWPLLLIAAGIALVVAGLIFAYQHWTGFRIVVDTVKDALVRFFTSLGPWLSMLGTWVQGAIAWFGKIPGAVGGFFSQTGSTIQSWVANIGGFFSSIGNAVGGFFNAIGTTLRSWVAAVGGFFNTLGLMPALLLGMWRTAWTALVGLVASAINTVIGWFMTAYNHSYLFKNIVDFITGQFTALQRGIGIIWIAILNFLANTWNTIRSIAITIHNSIAASIGGAMNTIRGVIVNIWSAITGFLTGTWNRLQSGATIIWNAITARISATVNAAHAIITSVWNAVAGFLSAIWNMIVGRASAAWNAFVGLILGAVGRASGAAHSVGQSILSAILGYVGQLYNAGVSIIEGLIRGMGSMLGAVKNKIGQIASAIGKGIHDALGIHSPSTMMIEVGQNLGLGLIQGLMAQDVPGQVAKHLAGIGGASIGGLNVGVSGAVSSSAGGGGAVIARAGGSSGGGGGGYKTANIYFSIDGRTFAQSVGQPLVDEIRLRTGQRI